MKVLFVFCSALLISGWARAGDHADDYHHFVNISPFGLRTEASAGVGKFRDKIGAIPSRTMRTGAIELMPGYRWQDFLFGPIGEVKFVGQQTDPANVGGQNLKGVSKLFGVGAAYRYGRFDLMAGFEFLGSHSLSKLDALDRKVVYKSPKGIQLQLGYFVGSAMSLDLKLSVVTYSKDELDGVPSDVSTDKRKQSDGSVGITYHI